MGIFHTNDITDDVVGDVEATCQVTVDYHLISMYNKWANRLKLKAKILW
jgi:hypothetical protein